MTIRNRGPIREMFARPMLVICLCFFSLAGLFGQAENELLSRSFWKGSPDLEMVQNRMAEGDDPAELDRFSFDALSWALIEKAPENVLLYLLDQPGNDVNKLTHDGRTYIFWAAYRNNQSFMKTLVSRGAKTDIVDSHGYSLLNFSAVTGQTDITLYDFILAHGAQPAAEVNLNGANALLLVAPFLEDTQLVDYFEGHGVNMQATDEDGANFFHYACKGGKITFLNGLIQRGFAPDAMTHDGRNAAHFVAMATRGKTNAVEVYQMMDSLGLDLTLASQEGKTPLWYALQGDTSSETLAFLMELGTDVQQSSGEGENALMVAAYRHEVDVLQRLISEEVDINQVDKEGHSALSNAVRYNNAEVVSFLLEQGASTAPNANGGALLKQLAVAHVRDSAAFVEKAALLVAHGLDMGRAQPNGNTFFHLAVTENNTGLFDIARQAGANINHLNQDGYSALHLAAMQAQGPEAIKILIDQGASTDALTPFEETPWALAQENEQLNTLPEILELLEP